VGRADETSLRDRRARVSAVPGPDADPRGDPPPETTSAILAYLGLPVRAPPLAPARRDDGFDVEAADQSPADFES